MSTKLEYSAIISAESTFKIEVIIMEKNEIKAVIAEGDKNCKHRYREEKQIFGNFRVMVQICGCGRKIF